MSQIEDFDKMPYETKKAIATKLLNDKVLADLGTKEDLDKQPDIAIQIQAVITKAYVEKHSPNLETIAKGKYQNILELLDGKKEYTLSHILVENEKEALALKKQINNAGKNWKPTFKKLAKEK